MKLTTRVIIKPVVDEILTRTPGAFDPTWNKDAPCVDVTLTIEEARNIIRLYRSLKPVAPKAQRRRK